MNTARLLLFALLPISTFANSLELGLLVTEYPRLAAQDQEAHVEVPLEQLGEPIGRRYVTKSISPWRHKTERNAVARGFLKIDADGDYAFTTTSFYDRNLLMIDGKVVCGYCDGADKVVTVRLKKGLVPIASVGYVLGRGASGVTVQWRPPGQRELSAIPPGRLVHRGDGLMANWLTIVAKDFVTEIYHNGERIADRKRKLLLDRFGASVERVDIQVRRGDWLVFHVAHNRLRHGGTRFFAVAGNLDQNEFGFASNPTSRAWSSCDDPANVAEFIAHPDSSQFRDSAAGVERPAYPIGKAWEEGAKFMRQYGGADFPGAPLWGKEASTWIKFVAPGGKSGPRITIPTPTRDSVPKLATPRKSTPARLAILQPKRRPIQVISAIYGTGGKNADVTARVKQLVEVERKFFAANPGHLGADPNPYWNKGLHIVYYKDGVRREQRRNENEHILPESFYGPQDAGELTRWLAGTRWAGEKREIQFQENGLLTGPGISRNASWKALAANRLQLAWAADEKVEFRFDYVWSSFFVPNDKKVTYRIVN